MILNKRIFVLLLLRLNEACNAGSSPSFDYDLIRLDLIFEGFIAFSQIFLRYFRATLFSRGTNFRAPPLRENLYRAKISTLKVVEFLKGMYINR